MANKLSLEDFSKYIEDNMGRVGQVRREVEEIQVGFNSAYVEWKAEHDAALERLVEAVTARLDDVGPDLRACVEERIVEERRIIAERRQALVEKLIPDTQSETDRLLEEGQRLAEELRKENPRLDKREEQLKAQRLGLEEELKTLNQEIRRLSGCLIVIFNFVKVNKLDRQRHQVIGQLKTLQGELKRVREDWEELRQVARSEQGQLQSKWQALTLELAQMQGERDYLAEEVNRDQLALQRATRHVIDNLKDDMPCPAVDVKADLDRMVELNIQTDDYEAGLASVVSFLALLDGIVEGLRRFNDSVDGLLKEQTMHSAYLPKLDINLPGSVVAFHGKWDGLAHLVSDEHRMATNPTEFLAAVGPVMEQDLSEASIQVMFDGMGQALDLATREWRG